MNRRKVRLGVLVAATMGLALILYRAPPLHPPWLEEDSVYVDPEGVMIDLVEMAIDSDLDSEDAAVQLIVGRTTPENGGIRYQQSDVTAQHHRSAVISILESQQQPLKANYKNSEQTGWRPTDTVYDESVNVAEEESTRESQSKSVDQFLLETTNDTEKSGGTFNRSINYSSSVIGSLTLPVPFATLPLERLLHQKWVTDLQRILKQLPRGLAPVSIVTTDYKFRNVLLNWIIAAKNQANPPLTHIVVFSLDQAFCDLLNRRRIHCIFVSPSHYLTEKAIARLTKHIVFSEVMVLRMTAMRLMNHWGYDTANYDTDAIILKSPESLYLRHADSHMIGSYGHYPGELSRAWGTTVCYGMFMTRSSPLTEIFWNTMSSVLPRSMNDQARLNNAISILQPDWGNIKDKSIMQNEWVATTSLGFKVTVLPAKYICRQGCKQKHRSEYYVWHKGGLNSDGKMKNAQRGRLWFLRKDWENITSNSSATGQRWLTEITEHV